MPDLAEWIESRGVEDVECLVADMNGVLRGKIIPAGKFVEGARAGALRLASSVFSVTLTGAYAAGEGDEGPIIDPDTVLAPDLASLRLAPGFETPTAFVFAEARRADGSPWPAAPRHVLEKVLALFAGRGWRAVIAPELEFYLVRSCGDPALALAAPAGSPAAPYGLEALANHQDLIDQVWSDCEVAGLELESVIHESGPAQLEINFHHGDPVGRADETLIFKRLVRQAAKDRGLVATFMAKPLEDEAPSAMHLHCSLVDSAGDNLFADASGADSDSLRHFIGGLQTFLPQVAPLFAPNPNSLRRMRPRHSAPVSVEWGHDNRSCGLRIPLSDTANRRVEIRLPGADANPYLAMAAALASGWLGLEGAIEPSPEAVGNAYRHRKTLPRTMEEALDRFAACGPVREILGEDFVRVFLAVKEAELDAFSGLVTPWEREHLLSKV
ncbi:MAG: glutamine synthetase family protein [Caulobacteraceae bacterium]